MDNSKINSYHCTVEAAMDIIGGKYKAIILWHFDKGRNTAFQPATKAYSAGNAENAQQSA